MASQPGDEAASTDDLPSDGCRERSPGVWPVTRSTTSDSTGSVDAPVVRASPAETARLFDALDSEACRTVVRALEEGPMTAKELQDAGDIPLSTVYRCVNELVDTPLVEETTRVSEGGHHASEYSRPVETVVVSLDAERTVHGAEGTVLQLSL